MTARMILTGDVNLMYVEHPSVPFGPVHDVFAEALVFSNLECCLYNPPARHLLRRGAAYWPTNHEAGPQDPATAVIRAHTADQVPMHTTRPEIPAMNRPGIPPLIITWTDPAYLRAFAEDIAALRAEVDVVVVSCHWGLHEDVPAYMREIARAAIYAGAGLVIGPGPHDLLSVEFYKGGAIFYGLGSFSFHTGHGDRRHSDWLGMMAQVELTSEAAGAPLFRFVRHNDANETVLRACRRTKRTSFASLPPSAPRSGYASSREATQSPANA
jgi:hypothetical protein